MECTVIAFSGGVDSSFLLKTAQNILGEKVSAVILEAPIFSKKENKKAELMAAKWDIDFQTVSVPIMEDEEFCKNAPERCYICKKIILTQVKEIALRKGCRWTCDGSNSDDRYDFRPGIKALDELGIRSPLKEAGLGKEEIRRLAYREGLSNWNQPSQACLASRIPYYKKIHGEALSRIEQAEEALRQMGFRQVRVRHHGNIARIEVEDIQLAEAVSTKKRADILRSLKALGYLYICVDLEGFRSGSLNDEIFKKKRTGPV